LRGLSEQFLLVFDSFLHSFLSALVLPAL